MLFYRQQIMDKSITPEAKTKYFVGGESISLCVLIFFVSLSGQQRQEGGRAYVYRT